ncbi:MAG: trypsin-like peptidase domain-containing protein [Betaproteobacteria bacterium]|nr:trypsin-like peptidase domain-containing protein [Betaproteobacteria bacterium]
MEIAERYTGDHESSANMILNFQIQSIQSLYIESRFNGQKLSSATGFVAKCADEYFLITNRHVVTGKHNQTNECLCKKTAGIPNKLAIFHNLKDGNGRWIERVEPLTTDDNRPLWYEHPTLGVKADFVAVKLTDLANVELLPSNLGLSERAIKLGVTDKVSVVGFPFGEKTAGGLAIWATGSVASEPKYDHDGLPIILIDCRSREGQSGSPVLVYRSGSDVTYFEDGSIIANGMPHVNFLGIYSGRINSESDLGYVWKAAAIRELIASIY